MDNTSQIKKATGVTDVIEFDHDIFVYLDNLNDAKFFTTAVCLGKTFKIERTDVMIQLSRKKKRIEK